MNSLIGLISEAATTADRCDYEALMIQFSFQHALGVLAIIGAFGAVCVYILRQNRPPGRR